MRYLLRPTSDGYLIYRSPSGETVTKDWPIERALKWAEGWNRMIDQVFDPQTEQARIQRQQNQGTI